MKALTIWRPWPAAICHPSPQAKRVENRTWSPPRYLWRQDFAIHAGKTYERDAVGFIGALLGEELARGPAFAEGIVAVARLAGYRDVSGVAWWTSTPKHDGGEWFVGPVGWLLDDVRVLREPVPCRGAQGLWTVPGDVERAVRAQLVGAPAR